MMSALEERRRRAQYRAAHRGTLEMDWLLGRYAAAALAAMSLAELDRFEGLLTLPDPELHAWITTGEGSGESEYATLIMQIRTFHGLGPGQ
ncbi:MAG: succinate dehydrogenase assembly factor 2 [Sphingomonadales bacterium]|nr:succinate dehydrogenase assembly factor 2 [Sphingomonadales bacterium]